jgi:phage gpG-like protein
MVSIQVNVNKAVQDINKVKGLFQNQKKYKLFRNMSELLMKVYFAETFDKEGARRGHEKWIPLNPIYSAYKASKGKSTKPLILTGHGRASGKVLNEDRNSLKFGTEVPYMKYHQDGDGPPQREFLYLTDKDLIEIGNFLSGMAQVILDQEIGRS